MSSDPAGAWLRRPRPLRAPRARLACFPHAGGTAGFFRSWAAALPDDIELIAVQYPGREDRLREPPVADMDRMATEIVDALRPMLDLPLALFGHSLGAAVAYEVAHRLCARYPGVPAGLVVSGRPAPSRDRGGSVHRGSDEELCAELRRLGRTQAAVLDHPELLRLVLPMVRSDYRLSETYRPRPAPALPCPVLACLGADDPEVTEDEARAWSEVTSDSFVCQVFAGQHFYLVAHREAVLSAALATALPVAGQRSTAPGDHRGAYSRG